MATERMISIDPGDKHVGMAFWTERTPGMWECNYAGEFTPEESLEIVGDHLHAGDIHTLVVEQWRLRAEEAPKLVGQTMDTCKLIGKFELMVDQINMSIEYGAEWLDREIQIVMQEPAAKKPTYAVCKAKGYELVADRLGVPKDHAQDAEIHGVHYIKRALKAQIAKDPHLWEGAFSAKG